MTIKRWIFLGSVFIIFALIITFLCSCSAKDHYFKYWNNDCKAIESLKDFVNQAQDVNSKNYIHESDRIAVFDMDGTLMCEKFPTYFEWLMFAHRVLDDDSYKNKASLEEIELAKKIRSLKQSDKIPDGLEREEAYLGGRAYENMTILEYWDYVMNFMKTDAEGFSNMKRGEAMFKPMIEVVEYLAKNNFTIYIVSGTDRLLIRALIRDAFKDIPAAHVIGMDYLMKGEKQGSIDGLDYIYQKDEKIVRSSELKIKSVKMNKVVQIMEEINQYPCLAFGNSTGDESMLKFTTDNTYYSSMSFLVKCDDTEREYGNLEEADKIQKLSDKHGWQTISMKDDWNTIYNENVTKNPQ